MRLGWEIFVNRFLQHVVPQGFRRVPYYGFLANATGRGRPKMMCFALSRVEDGCVRFVDRRFAGLSNAKRVSSNNYVGADKGRLLCR